MKKNIRAGSVAGIALAAAALAAGCGTSSAANPPRAVVTKVVISTVPAQASTTPPASATSAAPSSAPAAPAQPAPAQPAPAPQFANATAVVSQFYQDITDHNYSAAWALGGANLSNGVGYATWVAGYADTTASIALGTASDFGSDQVQADLIATQLDGTVKTYTGTYTVQNGAIVAANIVQTS